MSEENVDGKTEGAAGEFRKPECSKGYEGVLNENAETGGEFLKHFREAIELQSDGRVLLMMNAILEELLARGGALGEQYRQRHLRSN